MFHSYFNEYAFDDININLLTSSCTLHRRKFRTNVSSAFTAIFLLASSKNFHTELIINRLGVFCQNASANIFSRMDCIIKTSPTHLRNPNDPARFIGKVAATEDGEAAKIHNYLDTEKIE